MPQALKHPEQRRNAHPPAGPEWRDIPLMEAPILPVLGPKDDEGEPWRKRTKAVWNSWRHDSVTGMWSEADIQFAFETINIHNAGNMSPSMLSEIRRRMESLGLTPKGRQERRWRDPLQPGVEGVFPGRGQDTETPTPASDVDRRARLSIVAT